VWLDLNFFCLIFFMRGQASSSRGDLSFTKLNPCLTFPVAMPSVQHGLGQIEFLRPVILSLGILFSFLPGSLLLTGQVS
jgi:hypothetical protein